ncbi:Class I glutamine amidotransferase-like protein [Mycena indigotica]|uniref:Class I glutamine amidotransferase-like protein n=1 Tax=Mycena indigotica TaxID=2126181 RepID=A0A8H6T7C1_9AGAR|nr:Class I glutamine amidotransferase-like protein [Mycena indigotica]KAF7312124.1 Class I glutamine amidotransferase-like protein [Mycena indigotica]
MNFYRPALGLIVAGLMQGVLGQPIARVLIYTATRAFRHDSIPTAVNALLQQSKTLNVVFDHTEDQNQFNDANLAKYDAIMFVSTTGEVLDDAGKAAFQKYLNLGGNFVGIHSCSDSLVNTTFYGQEVGAYFDYHPELQNATVDVLVDHPSTQGLPKEWHIQEEMYNFKSDPRSIGAVVVLAANESSYVDNGTRKFNQGTPHPSAWYQEHGAGVENGNPAGRSFYTSLGHLNETWQDVLFISHVTGGLNWALQANTTLAFNAHAKVGNSPSSPPSTGPSPSLPLHSGDSSGAIETAPQIALVAAASTLLNIIL